MTNRGPEATVPSPERGGEEQRSVLLVDDEEPNLEHLTLFFEKRGFAVHAHRSAAEALKDVSGGFRPSLVVTDYSMPGMDGVTFLEAFRRIMPEGRSIMLTAHGSVDTYIRSFSIGVFEYVNKPVDERELDRVVRAALEGAKKP